MLIGPTVDTQFIVDIMKCSYTRVYSFVYRLRSTKVVKLKYSLYINCDTVRYRD